MAGLEEEYKKYKQEIEARLQDFTKLSSQEYIHELFFCILTPQSNAEKCWQAIEELKNCEINNKISDCLKTKTRFYKNKTRYIVEASEKWPEIEKLINSNKNPKEMREEIVKNIKGLGLKEASHFLRNIGASNNELAILDRHILRRMQELNLIEEDKIKNNKDYLSKELILKQFSNKVNIPLDHLDLLFWKIESGRIFK